MAADARRALALAVLGAALAGCGYKGDLVLPEQDKAALPDKPKQANEPDPEAGG